MSAVGSADTVPHLCLVSLGLLNLQNQGPLFWICLHWKPVPGCLLKVLVAVTVSDSVSLLTRCPSRLVGDSALLKEENKRNQGLSIWLHEGLFKDLRA